jgi:probable addiction module antidote protein
MTLKTTPFDAAKHIDTPEAVVAVLGDALETGDAGYIAHVLGILARSKGMTAVAEKAGLGRESLYKALREGANPQLETVLKVVGALGLQLTIAPAANIGFTPQLPGRASVGVPMMNYFKGAIHDAHFTHGAPQPDAFLNVH